MPYNTMRSKRIAEIPQCDIVRINGRDVSYKYLLKLLKMEEALPETKSEGVKRDRGNGVKASCKALRESCAEATTKTLQFAGNLVSKPLKAAGDLLVAGSTKLQTPSQNQTTEPEGNT